MVKSDFCEKYVYKEFEKMFVSKHDTVISRHDTIILRHDTIIS